MNIIVLAHPHMMPPEAATWATRGEPLTDNRDGHGGSPPSRVVIIVDLGGSS
jgi:hypothetical protein